jgi:hypothetical protein
MTRISNRRGHRSRWLNSACEQPLFIQMRHIMNQAFARMSYPQTSSPKLTMIAAMRRYCALFRNPLHFNRLQPRSLFEVLYSRNGCRNVDDQPNASIADAYFPHMHRVSEHRLQKIMSFRGFSNSLKRIARTNPTSIRQMRTSSCAICCKAGIFTTNSEISHFS